jgi:hypothetical protein
MPEASLWLRAYVGVYVGTLTGRKQFILFIFQRGGTTYPVHIPYVVPQVVRQMEHHHRAYSQPNCPSDGH